MGREGGDVERLGELHSCVEFLAPHSLVVEALQVDDEDLGEAVDRQVLLDVDRALALRALEAGAYHALRLDKLLQALLQLYTAKKAHSFPRNLH